MKKYPLHITNHFNSLTSLKKRVQMIYSNQYKHAQLLKFTLTVPVLLASLVLLAFVRPYYSALQVLPAPDEARLSLRTAPPIVEETTRETPKASPKPAKQSPPPQVSNLPKLTIVEEPAKIDTPLTPKFTLTPKEQEVLASSAYFFRKNDEVKNAATQFYLNEVVDLLKKYPQIKLMVAGHTANWGDKEEDYQALSERRAKVIKKYLQDKGIDEKRLLIKGYGSTQPAAKNDTEFGKIRNNRVQFVILKKK